MIAAKAAEMARFAHSLQAGDVAGDPERIVTIRLPALEAVRLQIILSAEGVRTFLDEVEGCAQRARLDTTMKAIGSALGDGA
jgi:hypothetical protein